MSWRDFLRLFLGVAIPMLYKFLLGDATFPADLISLEGFAALVHWLLSKFGLPVYFGTQVYKTYLAYRLSVAFPSFQAAHPQIQWLRQTALKRIWI